MHRSPYIPGAIIGYRKNGAPIRVIAGGALNVDTLPDDTEQFQAYLDELNMDQFGALEDRLVARFGELKSADNIDEDAIRQLTVVRDQIQATRAERQRRRDAAARQRVEETSAAHREAIEALSADVYTANGAKTATVDEDGNPVEDTEDEEGGEQVESLAQSFVRAFERAVAHVQPVTAGGPDLNAHIRNLPLGQLSRHTPDPKVAPPRREPVLVASSDVPGRARNGQIAGISELVSLMGDRSRMLPPTRGNPNYVPVAKLQRDFRYRLNLDSTPEEIDEVLTAATDLGALVAAGGWCAPSELSYDFYNIVCEDGLLDLPSVGVLNRGGFRFPTSPSIASVFGSSAVWSWTEAQDISAADNGDTKTCARVPCPDFDEIRAACDGICVTAGNLTDYAYPELIENFLRLVMAVRAHVTNQSIINQLVAASTAVNMAGSGEGTAASVLNSVELQVIDYRERFRMCEDAILEAVFPRWVVGAIRADLANRNGVDLISVTNADIAAWFNQRSVRVQLVADWQSGFSGNPFGDPGVIPTAWPATVQYLLYAPGTFVRGQALQLDLGVVRDSTLNEKNDHTAAWMEDCYAVAMLGHESRVVTTDVCAAGVTGAADIVCPS